MAYSSSRTIRLGYLRLTQSALEELYATLRERISLLPETHYERTSREIREVTGARETEPGLDVGPLARDHPQPLEPGRAPRLRQSLGAALRREGRRRPARRRRALAAQHSREGRVRHPGEPDPRNARRARRRGDQRARRRVDRRDGRCAEEGARALRGRRASAPSRAPPPASPPSSPSGPGAGAAWQALGLATPTVGVAAAIALVALSPFLARLALGLRAQSTARLVIEPPGAGGDDRSLPGGVTPIDAHRRRAAERPQQTYPTQQHNAAFAGERTIADAFTAADPALTNGTIYQAKP